MNFNSPCKTMNQAAAELPESANVKLFIRHSIRFNNPVNGDYSNLLLTPEGIELAQNIGKAIDKSLGFCGASVVERCIQTAQAITSTIDDKYVKERPVKIIKVPRIAEFLGSHIATADLSSHWYRYFYDIQNNNTQLTEGITAYDEASPLLDCIFNCGGEEEKLDLLVSHDFNVVLLASALFGLKTGVHGENWCNFTEGIFFTGTRQNFTAWWRGEKKQFIDF